MKYPSARKFIITERYYKRSRPNQSLAQYEAWRTKNPAVVRAVVKKDPALRNHPRLEREVVKHEVRELKLGYTKYKDRSKPSRVHEDSKAKEPRREAEVSRSTFSNRTDGRVVRHADGGRCDVGRPVERIRF